MFGRVRRMLAGKPAQIYIEEQELGQESIKGPSVEMSVSRHIPASQSTSRYRPLFWTTQPALTVASCKTRHLRVARNVRIVRRPSTLGLTKSLGASTY